MQSGSFALKQQSLTVAEATGKAFAAKAGCPGQTARCLRHLPVAALVKNFPPTAAIPGVVDGKVLPESIGAALAVGRFARVPILNGTNHDEERIFVSFGRAVSRGTNVSIPKPVTTASYRRDIASVLRVPATRAAAIAAEYPPMAYASPAVAFSVLVGDANFACPALRVDRWTSKRVPTFAYEFNDNRAPLRFSPPLVGPPVATHGSELQYLFGLPNAPVPGRLNADQQSLAAYMRSAWTNFATHGNPSSETLHWAAFGGGTRARFLSLVAPRPRREPNFSARHHCGFWSAR